MNPEIWGPSAWKFLHNVTFNYPIKPSQYDMETAIVFFKSLGDMLPCETCTTHYFRHLKKYPIELYVNSRISLVKWLINIHNEVNLILNKKIYSIDEIIDNYDKKQTNIKNNKYLLDILKNCVIFLMLALCGTIIYLYTIKNKPQLWRIK